MADSSKPMELEQSVVKTKNDPKKESKKKRKQGKKFRAKFTEGTEETSQECSTLVRDEQDTEGNDKGSKTNVEENGEMSATNEELEKTAEKGEDASASQSDQVTVVDATVEVNKNKEESTSKNEQSSGEKRKSYLEQAKQDQTDGSKKGKRSSFILLGRSKRNSKAGRPSSGEAIRAEDMTDEYGIWTGESEKIAGQEYEANEQQADGKDERKIEQGAKSAEVKSEEAENSLEGSQEKSFGKGNKSKKKKHLPSFGRNKKKVEITRKYKEIEVPENETQESKGDGTEDCENAVNESNEPVLVDFRDSSDVVEAAEAEGDKKGAAAASKRKKSFLTLKRNKHQVKKRKEGEDELRTKTNESEMDSESKQNDDVSAADGLHVETEGTIDTEGKNSEDKEEEPSIKETKDVELQAKETSEAAETEEACVDKESSTSEEQKGTAAEETEQDSSKKNKKPSILRSFKKLKPSNKPKQGKKKLAEKEEKPLKADEEVPGEKVSKETTTEAEETAEGKNENCPEDEEGTPKTVKRKTSDLKNIGLTQAEKRKKEDGESFTENISDVEKNNEAIEEEKVLEQQDQERSEEISPLRAEENESSPQTNEELSQEKNNEQEQTENKESEEEDENPRVLPASDDTQDEEIWKEAHELCNPLMKTVKDLKERKETDDEKDAQVDKTTLVEPSSESEGALTGSQMETGEVDKNEGETSTESQDTEQDTEDESYGSAITVVSVEQIPSQETKIAREGTLLEKEGASAAIGTPKIIDPQAEPTAENSETETSDMTEVSRIENTTEPKTEDTKEHSETERSKDTEQTGEEEEHETEELKETSDAEEESYDSDSTLVSVKEMQSKEPQIEEDQVVSSETEKSQVAGSQAEKITESKAENPEDSPKPETNQLQVEQTTEPKTEDAEEQTETEVSEVSEPPKEETEQKTAESEDSPAADLPQDLESQVGQENKVETTDTEEMQAIDKEAVSESEVDGNKTESKDVDTEEMQVSNERSTEIQKFQEADSKAEDNTEPKAENPEDSSSETEKSQVPGSAVEQEASSEPKSEEAKRNRAENEVVKSDAEYNAEPKEANTERKRATDTEPAPEKATSEATKKSPKVNKLLQRRIAESLLTEPENNEKNGDEEIVMEPVEKKGKKDKKRDKETWVMVQHLEMTDEVARQLGHMLTLNAFKRTASCCTIV